MLLAELQFYLSSISRIAQRKIKFPLGAQIIIDIFLLLLPFFTCFLYREGLLQSRKKKGTEKAPAKTGHFYRWLEFCYLSKCLSFIQEDTEQDRDYQFKECLFICSLIKGMFQFVDPGSEFFYEDIITVHYLLLYILAVVYPHREH
jgi:hypothetical protein